MDDPNRLAVLIPCFNEEMTIAKVVRDFKSVLPGAQICVFDNASTDRTAQVASATGATVYREPKKGKGFAVRAMLDAVDADFYIMVDGDDTYPAERVRDLLEPVLGGRADMSVGSRLSEHTEQSFRPLHVFGNNLVRGLINFIFRTQLTDILSGYRAFNERFRRYVPIVSGGFEVETELTAQALYIGMTLVEVPVPYRERPPGSVSKLNTFRDGFRVLWKIVTLCRDFKPLAFFCTGSCLFAVAGVLAGILPILDYIRARYVFHVPLAILASSLMVLAFGSLCLGVVLHVLNCKFRELHAITVRMATIHEGAMAKRASGTARDDSTAT